MTKTKTKLSRAIPTRFQPETAKDLRALALVLRKTEAALIREAVEALIEDYRPQLAAAAQFLESIEVAQRLAREAAQEAGAGRSVS